MLLYRNSFLALFQFSCLWPMNEWIGHIVGFLFMGDVVFDGPKPISGGHIGFDIWYF